MGGTLDVNERGKQASMNKHRLNITDACQYHGFPAVQYLQGALFIHALHWFALFATFICGFNSLPESSSVLTGVISAPAVCNTLRCRS